MSQQNSSWGGTGGITGRLGNAWYGEGRQPGTTRAKLKGYLSGIKESYQTNYAGTFRGVDDFGDGLSEAYPDANITRHKDEEMILFPSYSRNHIKTKDDNKQDRDPNETEDDDTDSNGQSGQAIQQHWDHYEEKDAVTDVDVRGWLYTPHKGEMNRKQRLALGIARQLAGLPNIQAKSPSAGSPANSRDTSPHPIRQKLEEHQSRKDQRLIDIETENMLSKAQQESDKAERGEYSENYGKSSGKEVRQRIDNLRNMGGGSQDSQTMAERRSAWAVPSEMSQEEATLAHSNLVNRLRPFYANPIANAPVSAFFYNEKDSRQRTIYTNPYGQFALRAALDFVPTHVRILASENLSATQEIKISKAIGVSVISDIDDTIKHTGMLSGAREAFRNAFLRNLDDLVVDGVADWYQKLAKMGVQFHYVSNAPWQLFPALSRFFAGVGLPNGSYHLKQYSGMLQGIFEPVAERKKSTLDRISRDFPERYYILVGDSGEADLEVYTDFVRENPGRVLGVFIRDVTTPTGPKYFDSNLGPGYSNPTSRDVSPRRSDHGVEHDPELRAAIDASLKEFEAEESRRKAFSPNSTASARPRLDTSEDLISFSDSDSESKSAPPTKTSKPKPPPPRKPDLLRGSSVPSRQPGQSPAQETESQKRMAPPPPAPRRTSTASVPANLKQSAFEEEEQPPTGPPRRANTTTAFAQQQNQASLASQPLTAARAAGSYVSSRVSSAISSYYNYNQPAGSQSITNPSVLTGTSGSSGTPPPASGGLSRAQINRIELWKKRWQSADDVLKKEGVVLKSWRVGTDVIDESVRLVEKGEKLNKRLDKANDIQNQW